MYPDALHKTTFHFELDKIPGQVHTPKATAKNQKYSKKMGQKHN